MRNLPQNLNSNGKPKRGDNGMSHRGINGKNGTYMYGINDTNGITGTNNKYGYGIINEGENQIKPKRPDVIEDKQNINRKYKNLSILYNNICSVKSKYNILETNINDLKPDIATCVETKYKSILDIHNFDTYDSFHKLQIGNKTGGISTWCHKKLKPTKLDIDGINDEISNHYQWIICQNIGPTAICTVYLKNQSDREASTINIDITNRLLNHIAWCQVHKYEIIIIGDFNAHIGNDDEGIIRNNPEINNNGIIVREFIKNSNLQLINNSINTVGTWTWGVQRNNTAPQILDLLLCSQSVYIYKCIIDENNFTYGTGNGDHCFIYSKLGVQPQLKSVPIIDKNNPRWNIKDDTNWEEYKQQLSKSSNQNPESNIDILIDNIETAAKSTIGIKKTRKTGNRLSK